MGYIIVLSMLIFGLFLEIKEFKDILIFAKIRFSEIIFLCIMIGSLSEVIHLGINKLLKGFQLGVVAFLIILLVLLVLLIFLIINKGINEKGFISNRTKERVKAWREISKVSIVDIKGGIKVEIYGNFRRETIYFNRKDYHIILNLLKEKLPKESQVSIHK